MSGREKRRGYGFIGTKHLSQLTLMANKICSLINQLPLKLSNSSSSSQLNYTYRYLMAALIHLSTKQQNVLSEKKLLGCD